MSGVGQKQPLATFWFLVAQREDTMLCRFHEVMKVLLSCHLDAAGFDTYTDI